VDGQPVHRSKEVRDWAEQNREKIRLYQLPGYSPDLNPDELLKNDTEIQCTGQAKAGGPGGDGGGEGLFPVQAENSEGGHAVLPASLRRIRRLIRSLFHDWSNNSAQDLVLFKLCRGLPVPGDSKAW